MLSSKIPRFSNRLVARVINVLSGAVTNFYLKIAISNGF